MEERMTMAFCVRVGKKCMCTLWLLKRNRNFLVEEKSLLAVSLGATNLFQVDIIVVWRQDSLHGSAIEDIHCWQLDKVKASPCVAQRKPSLIRESHCMQPSTSWCTNHCIISIAVVVRLNLCHRGTVRAFCCQAFFYIHNSSSVMQYLYWCVWGWRENLQTLTA